MPRQLVALITVLAAVACMTRLTPEAEKLSVTHQSKDVVGCKSLGFVDARPPYSTPNDAMNEMKNKAAILGGNVLFVTNYSMKATGVAYRCDAGASASAGALGLQNVTQGDPKSVPSTLYELHSPMVIERIFPIREPSAWRKIKSLEDFASGEPVKFGSWPARLQEEISLPEWYSLGRYTCDGVSLRQEVTSRGLKWEEPGLRIRRLRTTPSGIEATLEATLYNPRTNHDRLVTLAFDVLTDDGAVIASSSKTQKSSANSKSGNNAEVIFLFSADEVKQVTRLRVTMSTKDY